MSWYQLDVKETLQKLRSCEEGSTTAEGKKRLFQSISIASRLAHAFSSLHPSRKHAWIVWKTSCSFVTTRIDFI